MSAEEAPVQEPLGGPSLGGSVQIDHPVNECWPVIDGRIEAFGQIIGAGGGTQIAHVFATIVNAMPNPLPGNPPSGATEGTASGLTWAFRNNQRIPGAQNNCYQQWLCVWAQLTDGTVAKEKSWFKGYGYSSGSGGCSKAVQSTLFASAPRFFQIDEIRNSAARRPGSEQEAVLVDAFARQEFPIVVGHDDFSCLSEPLWRAVNQPEAGNPWSFQVFQRALVDDRTGAATVAQTATIIFRPPCECGVAKCPWAIDDWDFVAPTYPVIFPAARGDHAETLNRLQIKPYRPPRNYP